MGGDQDYIAPIMTKGLNTYQFGNNAYSKACYCLKYFKRNHYG